MTLTELTEFLLARYAEDEAVADRWPDDDPTLGADGELWVDTHGHPIWGAKTRVLADCEAKRRIVTALAEIAVMGGNDWLAASLASDAAKYSLRALAVTYADHPDYRDEWKP